VPAGDASELEVGVAADCVRLPLVATPCHAPFGALAGKDPHVEAEEIEAARNDARSARPGGFRKRLAGQSPVS
jgi:hypothetical protein